MTSFISVQGEGFPVGVLREERIVAGMFEGTEDSVRKSERCAFEALPTSRQSAHDSRALRRFARQVRVLLVSLGV